MLRKLTSRNNGFAMVIGGSALFDAELFESGENISVIANAETMGDYTYKILDDGTVSITKYTGSDETVAIQMLLTEKAYHA